jgi:hypothetical protein
MFKLIISLVGVLLLLTALGFGASYLGFAQYAFFAPRYEGVRRDVMIQSRAYSEATMREMYRFKLQYLQAKTQDERDTIRAFALHEAESFDKDRLPPDLQVFLAQLGD